jgi:hypothetical protein
MTKTQRIIRYFTKNPTANVKDVAAKYKSAITTVYALRKQAMPKAQEELSKAILGPQIDTPEPIAVTMAPTANDRQVGGNHYKAMAVQPWNVVDTWPIEQRIGYYRGGALKYVMRLGTKDESPIEAGKGLHYLEKLVEVLHEQQSSHHRI